MINSIVRTILIFVIAAWIQLLGVFFTLDLVIEYIIILCRALPKIGKIFYKKKNLIILKNIAKMSLKRKSLSSNSLSPDTEEEFISRKKIKLIDAELKNVLKRKMCLISKKYPKKTQKTLKNLGKNIKESNELPIANEEYKRVRLKLKNSKPGEQKEIIKKPKSSFCIENDNELDNFLDDTAQKPDLINLIQQKPAKVSKKKETIFKDQTLENIIEKDEKVPTVEYKSKSREESQIQPLKEHENESKNIDCIETNKKEFEYIEEESDYFEEKSKKKRKSKYVEEESDYIKNKKIEQTNNRSFEKLKQARQKSEKKCRTEYIPSGPSRLIAEKNWDVDELLSEMSKIDLISARNIIELFKNDNTIPFIVRYRKDKINKNIDAEKLRKIKTQYTNILSVKKKANNILKQLEKDKKLTDEIKYQIISSKTIADLEYFYGPYKSTDKRSNFEKAKSLGLEPCALKILNGYKPPVCLKDIINPSIPELSTEYKVVDNICYIMSHVFSKRTEVIEEIKRLIDSHIIVLKCTLNKKNEEIISADAYKYEHYFNYESSIKHLKPHQVLAINRGEQVKVLSVKIVLPDEIKRRLHLFIMNLFYSDGINYQTRRDLFEKTFEECYKKKLQPYITKQIRSRLNEMAEIASIEVFAKNLKQLLLVSPLKGERILGIDPGFVNGCKLAMISETTDVLETGVVYPHTKSAIQRDCGKKLARMLFRHRCRIIALGNGTACRETEKWLSFCFEQGILDANKIKYSIVSEQAASIYSCSSIAKKEFPNMDVNCISAVSIARRLNDPLSEYIKIEPRHIGVGMYQHDIDVKQLSQTLNEVVIECVSFVGVDINTASATILKHIAGLNSLRAERIIEYRSKYGPFKARKDILKVKGVGEKTFLQCAGFIRIEPLSVGGQVNNPLDCTWIHPECYDIALKIIKKCNLRVDDIGQEHFINKIKNYFNSISYHKMEEEFKLPKERVITIFEGLQRELLRDYRCDINKKPLFKEGIKNMRDLKVGKLVTGVISNITHFGAFVDIGVEHDGLIHTSRMNGLEISIGDRIEGVILNVDIPKSRIAISLESIL